MISRPRWLVYGALTAVWVLLIVWQSIEHVRVHHAAEDTLIMNARGIVNTCGVLMRSRRFFGVSSRENLEAGLKNLVNTNRVHSILLLNDAGQPIAAAGVPFVPPTKEELQGGVHWGEQTAVLDIPVDLGTNITADAEGKPELVLSPEQMMEFWTNRPRSRQPEETNGPPPGPRPRRFDLRVEKPSWMKEEEYHTLLQQAGVHSFLIVMSTAPIQEADANDLLIRVIIGFLGTLGVAGYGLAWRNMIKTSDLQLRLVRASELNLHLKEMNLAAAGLAHETRNPLNIIRGLAQLVGKHSDASPEVREKARDIVNQTDRVTAQLNEFINYSRPREVRRSANDLNALVNEVTRTLAYDVEEKKIQLQTLVEPIVIEADEQLLRQALFNLVLNAVQAVPPGGAIKIRASRRNNEEGFIEISDNGPGVPPENRAEIFKPYFTTNEEGTGLGLSIVQQIILAHGWEIQCLANEPQGALFRVSHLKLRG